MLIEATIPTEILCGATPVALPTTAPTAGYVLTATGTNTLAWQAPAAIIWGNINGTLSNQTDLQTALGAKLTATNNLSDLTNVASARTNLGLGSAALQAASYFLLATAAGVANGVATLDGGGHVPISQLPTSVVGDMQYQGTWNASTNSPTLASGTGTKGYFYKVSVAGTTTIDGNSQWNVGDSIVFDGTTWDKIDGITNEVITVFGRYGVVTAQSGDYSVSQITGALSSATAASTYLPLTGGTLTGALTGTEFLVGTLTYSDTGILEVVQSSTNSYNQFIIQNSSNGAAASSDVVVNNNNSTATTYYGDFGMNSSGFTGTGAFNQPNYVYVTSTSVDLAIGTTTSNGIHFVVNSGATDAMTISSAGNTTVNGLLSLPQQTNSAGSAPTLITPNSTANGIGTSGGWGLVVSSSAGTDPNPMGVGYTEVRLSKNTTIDWCSQTSILGPSTPDTYLSRKGTANLQFGAADAASPVAQTLSFQSVVAGNANTAAPNVTIVGPLSNGSGSGGNVIIQTTGTGASSGVQNSAVTALTLAGGTQAATFAGTITSLAHTVNVNGIATTSTTGLMLANGTASTSSVPVQYSPAQQFQARVWNTTSTADNYANFLWDVEPTSGANPTAVLRLKYSLDSGTRSYSTLLHFDNYGNLNLTNNGLVVCYGINATNTNICGSTGAASQALWTTTAAPYSAGTGTTNWPQWYARWGSSSYAPTTFSAGGTVFGAFAANAWAGNFIDFYVQPGATTAPSQSIYTLNYVGTHTTNIANIITGTTDAIVLVNPTASTSGVPVQNSPGIHFQSHAYNTGTPADNYCDFRLDLEPTSGNPVIGYLALKYSVNTGTPTWTLGAKFDSNGSLTLTGNLYCAVVSLTGLPKFGGTNTTGSGATALGSNCPAVTATAPYTWVKATAADGSTIYIPAWK